MHPRGDRAERARMDRERRLERREKIKTTGYQEDEPVTLSGRQARKPSYLKDYE